MSNSLDHYEILQVHPAAEPEIISMAYKGLARLYHPDRNKSPDAVARMTQINLSYEVLSDPQKRAEYDKSRARQTNFGGHDKRRSERRRSRGAGFGLVINDRNEILLIQRGYGREKGKWSMPGGNQDRGESLKRTAVRETREETGIRMSADRLYYKGRRRHMEVWRGKRTGGRIKIQRHECWDAKWFGKDMLPHDDNLAFGPDKIAIGKWAKEDHTSRRVHYPHRVKLGRVGFGLVVNRKKEILLIRQGGSRRKDKWSLPGGRPRRNEGRQDAAVREIRNATGVKFSADRLYYENRHRAKVWIGKPNTGWLSNGSINLKDNASWFPIDKLPDDDSLAFAVEVRTIEKWANENKGSRRVSY